MHGSFVRHKASPQTEARVPAHDSVELDSGDQIRFGTDIHRHHEKYPPCVVDFESMWRNLYVLSSPCRPSVNPKYSSDQAKKSPNTFSVPYGSDEEDPTSDTDSVILMEKDLAAITKSSNTTIDLTTEGNARPQPMNSHARIIDLTAEPDVGSDVSMMGRYSPVLSSRRSLSRSPAADMESTPVLTGSGAAEWTDVESDEEGDSNSQASEDPEDLLLLDEDNLSIDSEHSAGFTSLSEETSDDSMDDSDIELGSSDEDSDAESYEDDEEDGYGYDWEATRTFGLPINAVQGTTGTISLFVSS